MGEEYSQTIFESLLGSVFTNRAKERQIFIEPYSGQDLVDICCECLKFTDKNAREETYNRQSDKDTLEITDNGFKFILKDKYLSCEYDTKKELLVLTNYQVCQIYKDYFPDNYTHNEVFKRYTDETFAGPNTAPSVAGKKRQSTVSVSPSTAIFIAAGIAVAGGIIAYRMHKRNKKKK